MTDELAAIEERHQSDDRVDPFCEVDEQWFPCDVAKVLAALHAEQEARARVEAALDDLCYYSADTGLRFPYAAHSPLGIVRRIEAALAPDASEGEPT